MVVPPTRVFIAQCDSDVPAYAELRGMVAPELPDSITHTTALRLLRTLLRDANLDSSRYGTVEWNPLGALIQPGDRVLLKPNWVVDRTELADESVECVVTHRTVIEAVLHYVVKAQPLQIVVGDAPIQRCDFANLRSVCGIDDMCMRFKSMGHDIQIRDFRLTRSEGLYRKKVRLEFDPDDYCLFDLGDRSWLAPVTEESTEFRVTNYDPDILRTHHQPGRHQYLVARGVMDADVVINLPKLKTHSKAGISGALKNMVGINGLKEYLPHHRKGGSDSGGDCYSGARRLKDLAEESLDRANRAREPLLRYLHTHVAGMALRLDAAVFGGDRNLEGSWYGNDTVWRTCLDLQRIVHYGTSVCQMSPVRQRRIVTVTDGVIAGDGDGPLVPRPVPLGVMTLGVNVAAIEWVHCLLMGFDPRTLPLVTGAFQNGDWPLADFGPSDIEVSVNGETLADLHSIRRYSHRFCPPTGWSGHCESSG